MPYSVASRTLAVTPIVALFDNFSASLCQFNGAGNCTVHANNPTSVIDMGLILGYLGCTTV